MKSSPLSQQLLQIFDLIRWRLPMVIAGHAVADERARVYFSLELVRVPVMVGRVGVLAVVGTPRFEVEEVRHGHSSERQAGPLGGPPRPSDPACQQSGILDQTAVRSLASTGEEDYRTKVQ